MCRRASLRSNHPCVRTFQFLVDLKKGIVRRESENFLIRLINEPSFPGCLMEVRPVGMLGFEVSPSRHPNKWTSANRLTGCDQASGFTVTTPNSE